MVPWHYRIIFKICTVAYQALSSTQTVNLNSILTPARNSRQLRSTSSNSLYIPRVKTKAGTRALSVAAPTVWNSLLASVKSEGNIISFRRRLNTYLCSATINWQLTHCCTVTSLLNPLFLSRHWAWSSRILAQRKSFLLLSDLPSSLQREHDPLPHLVVEPEPELVTDFLGNRRKWEAAARITLASSSFTQFTPSTRNAEIFGSSDKV